MANDLTKLVKEAAAAAKHAPKHLQEAAFNKVFDALVFARSKRSGPAKQAPSGGASRGKRKKPPDGNGSATSTLDEINRASHPEIRHTATALDNALRLLLAAKDDLNIDGLTAATIARVLTQKFRCKVTRQAVGQALNGAGRYVNRHSEGRSVIFSIMAPGEEYLLKPKEATAGGRKKATRTSKEKGSDRKSAGPRAAAAKKAVRKTSKKTAPPGRLGPAAALTLLSEDGFFSSPRMISEIVDQLKHSYGHTFKPNEMSTPLLRFLRSGRLVRSKNSDNQYEYRRP